VEDEIDMEQGLLSTFGTVELQLDGTARSGELSIKQAYLSIDIHDYPAFLGLLCFSSVRRGRLCIPGSGIPC
jgi:hypothetical protein